MRQEDSQNETTPFLTSGVANTIGSATTALSQWVILAGAGVIGGARSLGEVGLAYALTGPVFMFCSLRLRQVVSVDFSRRFGWATYWQLRSRGTAFALLLVGVLLTSSHRVAGPAAILTLFVALFKAAEAQSDVIYGELQRLGKSTLVGVLTTTRSLLTILLFTVAGYTTRRLDFAILATGIGAIAHLLVADARSRRHFSAAETSEHDPRRGRALLMDAAPLGFVSLLASLTVNIPRYAVAAFEGIERLGLYSLASYIPVVTTLLYLGFAQTILPRLGEAVATKRSAHFRQLHRRLEYYAFATGASAVVILAGGGDRLLIRLLGRDVAGDHALFVFMGGVGLANCWAVAQWFPLAALNKHSLQLRLYLGELLVNVLLSIAATSVFGIYGASASLALVYILHGFAARYFVIHYHFVSEEPAVGQLHEPDAVHTKQVHGDFHGELRRAQELALALKGHSAIAPEVVSSDPELCHIGFTKLPAHESAGAVYLRHLRGEEDGESLDFFRSAGEALAVLHDRLPTEELPEWQSPLHRFGLAHHDLPPKASWVAIHGDYGFTNVLRTIHDRKIAIVDSAPSRHTPVGTRVLAPPQFDVGQMLGCLAGLTTISNSWGFRQCDRRMLMEAFLEGYEAVREIPGGRSSLAPFVRATTESYLTTRLQWRSLARLGAWVLSKRAEAVLLFQTDGRPA